MVREEVKARERRSIYFKYKKERKKKGWNQKSERKTDLYVPETVPCSAEIAEARG